MRNTHTAWTLALTLLLVVGCAAPQQDNTDEASAGIEATNAQFMEAFSQGDAAGVAACYTEDAQLMPPNSEIVSGRAALQEGFQELIDGGYELQLETTEVEGHGDTAHEIGTYTMAVDGETVDEGKYIVIWKNVDGQWKLHRDIFNSNNPPPAPAPEAPAGEEEM